MSGPHGRAFVGVLSAVLSVLLASACSSHRTAAFSATTAPTKPPTAGHPTANSLSAILTAEQRKLVLAVVRTTARATRPRVRGHSAPRLWTSNVTRAAAAVASLSDAAAWKQPGTNWQLSDRREASRPVLIVQMFGRFRFFRLWTRPAGGPPLVAKYDVPELTYVISTLDGAHLSEVRGGSLPDLAPAQTIVAR